MNQETTNTKTKYFNVAPNVWGMKDIFVNFYMIKNNEDKHWVLIDTGLKISAPKIKKMAAELFGEESRPKAIILTHGHFDHVGSLKRLAAEWNVPVYAHYLELPYLTGKSSYPPADPSVGGGLMATMSFAFPNTPINAQDYVTALPEDHSVPYLKGWKYIETPGHAPGHISLFREEDKVLIAGDAFVTTRQASALAVAFQIKKLSGPPSYFTYDWEAADESVKKLVLLAPEVVATGHGRPMYGKEMRKELHNLHDHFQELAVPSHGRYVKEPAVADVNGILYIPPQVKNPHTSLILGTGVLALAAALYLLNKKATKKKRFRLNF